MITTIKRPFKLKKLTKDNFLAFQALIQNTNLFIHNIYLYINSYYIFKLSNHKLTSADILIIFKILRDGRDYCDHNCHFYKFYCDIYEQIYFNPKKTQDDYLICGKKLDQVIQVNAGTILANITNNITINFDKYLNKFIKSYMKIKCKDTIEYNNLIKKCSSYECYPETKVLEGLIKLLKVLTIRSDNYITPILQILANNLTGKIKKYKRTKNNIFNNEIANIKNFEETFNEQKKLIKKYILGEIQDNSQISIKFKDLLQQKNFIVPKFNKCYDIDLQKEPFNFVPAMIYINNYLENNNIKTFNVFPTRQNCVPKHITLDTESVNVYFCKKMFKNLSETRNQVFKEVFKFDDSYFLLGSKNKENRLKFTGTIQTDGVSLSLQYQKEDNYAKTAEMHKNKYDAKIKKETMEKNLCDNIAKKFDTITETAMIKIEELNEKLNEINFKLNKKKNLSEKNKKKLNNEKDDLTIKLFNLGEIIDKRKENEREEIKKQLKRIEIEKQEEKVKNVKIFSERKKLENTEQKNLIIKLREEGKFDDIRKIERKNKEFWYIDDLTDKELENLNKEKLLYIDQGKGNLIYVLNDENNSFMQYSNKERRYNLNTNEHIKNINVLMEGYGINEELEKIKNINKKSSNTKNFIENIKKINEINDKNYNKSNRKKLRKEKLEIYIDSQKAEKKMIKKILLQLGIKNVNELKTYTIIIGDWKGNNSLKNNMSTLGISMKRTLRKYVKEMYLIDEYNTSKLSNLNFTQTKEHILEINSISKKGEIKLKNKQMHSILSFQMSKIRMPCKFKSSLEIKEIRRFIQRDKNAVLNFRTITEHYINNNRERLIDFKRNQRTITRM
jgi:hypothetical protein